MPITAAERARSSGLFGFHDHHARTGPVVAAGLFSWRRRPWPGLPARRLRLPRRDRIRSRRLRPRAPLHRLHRRRSQLRRPGRSQPGSHNDRIGVAPAPLPELPPTTHIGGYSRGSYPPVDHALRSEPGADVQARRRRECRRGLSWPPEAGFALPAFPSLSAGAQRPGIPITACCQEQTAPKRRRAAWPVRQNYPVKTPLRVPGRPATGRWQTWQCATPRGVAVTGSGGNLDYSPDLVMPGPSR